ncbi:TPA: capsule biosynthesis protein CapK [Streptococcus agalactiae]|uniref:Capsular polysaccharide repeating-unit polymerase n=4 Tax=Streptococcus agalactiae TaxID=1311 RepID=Q9RPC4_STRAG|nr:MULTISPECIES: capsule biosynthesis protein CapK [Streptococcus]EPW99704.1 capsule biosynthesis protein CapK [Streptococcus agalactiae MRI Z1-049]AAD53069.1 CpsH [Streptococcus agalactiae COH1]AAL56364.1 CpsH [Streptococcus agalactiae]AAL56371.1 CpsH [Streptococcus agalactiae]AAL57075.1 CpsIaH [Streptococcus agalactiae]
MRKYLDLDYSLFYALWVLILVPNQWYQFLIITIIVLLLLWKSEFRISISNSSILFLLWLFIYLFAILIRGTQEDITFQRFIAELLKLISTGYALFFYNYYRKADFNSSVVRNVVKVNYFVLFLITVLYLFFPMLKPTLFGRELFSIEWFPHMRIRLAAYFEYATLIGQFILFSYPILFLKPQKHMENILISLLLTICSYFSGARILLVCMLVLLASLLLDYILFKTNLKLTKKNTFILGMTFLFITACFSYNIWSIIEKIIMYRNQSTITRMIVYQESIIEVLKGNILFGQGIRIPSSEGIFLGSHSTYISVFYRTSLLGIVLYFSAFILLYKEAISKNYKIYRLFFYTLLCYTLFEEIDPNHWSIVLLFSTFGIVGRAKK